MHTARLLTVALLLALAGAACGGGYDRGTAYDDLTGEDFNFTDEQANCVLDEVEAQGLEDVVIEDDPDAVDPVEFDAVLNIFSECTLGETLDGGSGGDGSGETG